MSKILNILIGISGSGKTTFAQANEQIKDSIVLSSDHLRGIIGGDEGNQAVNAEVFQTMKRMTDYFLSRGESVTIDATNLSVNSRSDFVKLGGKHSAEINCFFFDVSIETCMKRIETRKRKVSFNVVQRQAHRLERVSPSECNYSYIVDEMCEITS